MLAPLMNCMANVDNPGNDNHLAFCRSHKVGQEMEGEGITLWDRGFTGQTTVVVRSCILSSIKHLGHLAIIPTLRFSVMIDVWVEFHMPCLRLVFSLSTCQLLGVLGPSLEVTTFLFLGQPITS